jgi:SagB-type dehydrogenase family enzyme
MSNKLISFISLVIITLFFSQILFSQTAAELSKQAGQLYQKKQYKEAAAIYEQIIGMGNSNAAIYYNAACCYALAGDKEGAFKVLAKCDAKMLSYYAEEIKADPDLEILHSDKRWNDLNAEWTAIQKKMLDDIPTEHTFMKTVELPEPSLKGKVSVEETLASRRSRRSYQNEPISLQEVSQILWAAYGISEPIPGGPAFLRGGLRTAPSAGALYPLDIYLVAGNVTGLPAGVYYYDSENHALKLITDTDKRKELCAAANSLMMVENAPADLVWSCIPERTTKKYGERGKERYIYMDLGHSAENVYLQCEALGIGTCAIGAFSDAMVKSVVRMTKSEEPLYIMPIGKMLKDED